MCSLPVLRCRLRVGFAATFWLCSVAIAAASDEPTNMAKSVERKLQAIYDVVSPAVVKCNQTQPAKEW
jgi:hypothetical protein